MNGVMDFYNIKFYLSHQLGVRGLLLSKINLCFVDQTPEFFYKESDFPTINLSEILKKSKSEEMFQFIDVYAGGGYC